MNRFFGRRANITCYLALGTNLGDREDYIANAIKKLRKEVQITKISPIYQTEPWGILEQGSFLNLCIEINTKLSPLSLLGLCKAIEQKLGRKKAIHWGPREIDIDIIFYGQQVIRLENLVIPHKELIHRQFVLKPLADIAPKFIHPELQLSVQDLSAKLSSDGIDFYADLNENKNNGDSQSDTR